MAAGSLRSTIFNQRTAPEALMEKILYANKKDEIREVLLQRARAGLTIYYSELGELLKISPLGP
jgi:hypothetical protein